MAGVLPCSIGACSLAVRLQRRCDELGPRPGQSCWIVFKMATAWCYIERVSLSISVMLFTRPLNVVLLHSNSQLFLLNTSSTDVAVVLNKTEENDMNLKAHTEAIVLESFRLTKKSLPHSEVSSNQWPSYWLWSVCYWRSLVLVSAYEITDIVDFSDSEVVIMKFAIGIKGVIT